MKAIKIYSTSHFGQVRKKYLPLDIQKYASQFMQIHSLFPSNATLVVPHIGLGGIATEQQDNLSSMMPQKAPLMYL